MNLDWLAASNPVAIWWCFLLIVSTANIALWMLLHRRYRQMTPDAKRGIFRVEALVLLCAAYVFGCAFRSVLPRARRSENLSVRYLAVERLRGAISRNGRRDLLRPAMGHRAAPTRQAGKGGYGTKNRDGDRSSDPACGDLLLVRRHHGELSRQYARELVVGGDLPAHSGCPAAAAQ